MKDFIHAELLEIAEHFKLLASYSGIIADAALHCRRALENNRKIMFCGNGGSAADSQHLAAELIGRYKLNRKAMNAIALTVDTSILTAVGNDYGYDTIFRRQVEGLGQEGDVLVGLSTSGNSENVVQAFLIARNMGISTIALTGQGGGKMKELADFCINVPSDATNHIQEMHIAVGHLICGLVEQGIYGHA
ncbi:D-sedoheptulose 7-phosphate isomerase [Akkermansia sp. N21116]|jgi:D-sedoheptulose 7-phosphate isomerase|uniref:D-sedoheptulose 7-phosphate isomerase n=1 Tax=Akkermansia sp. N21116 TaxID=3040764 RepID=UPI00244EA8E0|nr:D-sedoheptulose 7-phosphate isomerase [Akkermansia sp. N21116]WPX40025.1 D-sedoheptulose 7-phosphate isomerase [Akkermansia sp. N21116]